MTAPTSTTTQRLVTVATPTSATPSSGSGEWNYDIESGGSEDTEEGGGAVELSSGDNVVD